MKKVTTLNKATLRSQSQAEYNGSYFKFDVDAEEGHVFRS